MYPNNAANKFTWDFINQTALAQKSTVENTDECIFHVNPSKGNAISQNH